MGLNDKITMQSNYLQSNYHDSEYFGDGCADSTGESKEIQWHDRKMLQALHQLFATFSHILCLIYFHVLLLLSRQKLQMNCSLESDTDSRQGELDIANDRLILMQAEVDELRAVLKVIVSNIWLLYTANARIQSTLGSIAARTGLRM